MPKEMQYTSNPLFYIPALSWETHDRFNVFCVNPCLEAYVYQIIINGRPLIII